MAISDSDIYIDARAAGNVSPLTAAGTASFGGGLQIQSNLIKPISGVGGLVASGSITTATPFSLCVMGTAHLGDPNGPALLDSDGDGFWLRIRNPSVAICAVTTYVLSDSDLDYSTPGSASGDEFGLRVNGSVVESYKNGVLINTVSIGSLSGLRPAYFASLEDSNNTGANQIGFVTSDAPSGPSVNPTGTDVALTVGTASEIVMQNMGGATATALTLRHTNGELVVNTVQADFGYTSSDADTGTVDFTATVGNLPYGSTGYEYVITLSAGDPVVYTVASLSPESGRANTVVSNHVDDSTGLIYQGTGEGSDGDQYDLISAQAGGIVTVRPNGTFYITGESFPSTATLAFNYWSIDEGVRYPVTADVAFSEDGEGTVTGIAARNITLRGITMRNITSRGL